MHHFFFLQISEIAFPRLQTFPDDWAMQWPEWMQNAKNSISASATGNSSYLVEK